MIKVSVIIPVYDVYDYIDKCLNSLVNQTLKDIEIIVVNDGSPSNEEEIINKYLKKYKFIKYYKKPNGGLSDARNYGLDKAKGEYISFIDSDDYIDNQMLEKMYNHAKKHKLDIVTCDCYAVYPNDTKILLKSNNHYSDNDICNYLISQPSAWLKLYKKEIFKDIRFTKGIYYEDLDLTPKLVNITKKIGFLEEPLYYYIQRTGSIMKQTKWNDKLLDIYKVLDGNRVKLVKKYPEEIEYMYITHLLRTASLRFLDYENYKIQIDTIINTMKKYFPNWKNNKYYKKSSIKLKLICVLAYKKQIFLLKQIKKITNK